MTPCNPRSEQAVIGACIEENHILLAVVNSGLTPEDFSLSDHARFFRALTEMLTQGIPVDIISVAEFLGNDSREVAALADCVCGVVVEVRHILHHAGIIRKKARLRTLLHLAEWIETTACDPHADPDELGRMVAMKLGNVSPRLAGVQ
jgi:replicative DNA helicase